eukprot:Phypoly_transcript_01385.p2 GENE.Phypoly_transcript_01385~~Phypoly_transcript_01385.p2  ORF type:complete len:280 (-),score=82.51 Phypoly_transcript_01385:2319-3158(-)
MEILDSPKWKLLKQRPDTETWTAKDDGFFAIKICGSVRTSLRSLQEYVHANKIIRAPPNFVKGGVVKVYDDVISDHLVTYKTDSKNAREYVICKHDHMRNDDQSVSLVWCVDNQRKSGFSLSSFLFSTPNNEISGPWGAFKAVGCIIHPHPENPRYCWLMIIFNLEKKVPSSSEGMDVYLYKTLQRVRTDTEQPEAPRSPSPCPSSSSFARAHASSSPTISHTSSSAPAASPTLSSASSSTLSPTLSANPLPLRPSATSLPVFTRPDRLDLNDKPRNSV